MKSLSVAIAAFCALATHATLASAQSAWDERYDNRFQDPYDQSDPRRYDDRQNDDRQYDDRNDESERGADSGQRGRWQYRDLDEYDQWDAAPSAAEEAEANKTPGVSGGPRPYIAPVAPPKVAFSGPYAPGSVVIDTSARKLYYVINPTTAYAYSIGVGREGFAWTGKEKISRIADWPDWYPPAEMRQRQPGLPKRMLGGINNPLGVKAIYLGNTLYRIHGTNEPKSIGKAMSSGCIRMMNANVLHLASLVHVGTEVNVVRSLNGNVVASNKTPKQATSEPAWNERANVERRPRPYWDDDDDYYSNRGRQPYPYDDDWR